MTTLSTPIPTLRRTPGTPSVGALVWWTSVALILAGGAISAGLMWAGREPWWGGFLAASVVSTLAAAIGLVPLVAALWRGTKRQFIFAWLGGSMLRAGTAVVGCIVAITRFHADPTSTFLVMVLYYFAVLGAETLSLLHGLRKTV